MNTKIFSLFLILSLLLSFFSFGQSKFYLMPEIGINKSITSSDLYRFTDAGLNVGLKLGYEFTDNLALETGMQWSQLGAFPSFTFYNQLDNNTLIGGYGGNTISSNRLFSVPLHLKISHPVLNGKLKIVAFFGPQLLFGQINSGRYIGYTYNSPAVAYDGYSSYFNNGDSMGYTNADIDTYNQFKPRLLFDGGVGVEYVLTDRISTFGKFTYTLGTKRINSNTSLGYNLTSLDTAFEDVKWKGDNMSFSLGTKIRF